MEEAQKNGQLEASYSYDFRGERIRKATASDKTAFLIDNNNQTGYSQALREVDSTNEEKVSYTFGDDLISQDRADAPQGQSALSFLHYDGLGSTRALTSTAAIATDTFSYLAFGAILNKTGDTPITHLFIGEAYDFNLGYNYLRARLYNPITGRFASLDPFGGVNFDPRSLHKYYYTYNNSINDVDLSGYISAGFILTILAMMTIILYLTAKGLRYKAKAAFCNQIHLDFTSLNSLKNHRIKYRNGNVTKLKSSDLVIIKNNVISTMKHYFPKADIHTKIPTSSELRKGHKYVIFNCERESFWSGAMGTTGQGFFTAPNRTYIFIKTIINNSSGDYLAIHNSTELGTCLGRVISHELGHQFIQKLSIASITGEREHRNDCSLMDPNICQDKCSTLPSWNKADKRYMNKMTPQGCE